MASIPRPANPFVGGLGLSPELMNPQPIANQPAPMPNIPRAVPRPPMRQPAPQQAMPSPDPLAGAPMLGQQPQQQGGLRAMLSGDPGLAFAAGVLGNSGDPTGMALGGGFAAALQARQAQNKPAATTDDIKEFAYARSQGYQGTFPQWMMETRKAGATNVNVGQSEYGTIPQGFQLVRDEAGNLSMSPIPGGPEDKTQQQAAANQTAAQSADVVLGAIDDAETIFDVNPKWTTGLGGSIMLNFPGSGAVDLQAAIEPIEASIAFDRLQRMRQESPTGGALGAVSERELALLSATVASLKQSQSPEAFDRNLTKVKTVYRSIAKKFAAYPNASTYGFAPPETYDDGGQPGTGQGGSDPLGIR